MENLFPDIKEVKKESDKVHANLPEKIKAEFLSEIPKRIERNAKRGQYYVEHYSNNFSYHVSKQYIKTAKEVAKLLIEEGYDVKTCLSDYNGYYSQIIFLIAWDIEKVMECPITKKCYNEYLEDNQIISLN